MEPHRKQLVKSRGASVRSMPWCPEREHLATLPPCHLATLPHAVERIACLRSFAVGTAKDALKICIKLSVVVASDRCFYGFGLQLAQEVPPCN